jgi:glycosyltransferase involved in cell wall biosynthesis
MSKAEQLADLIDEQVVVSEADILVGVPCYKGGLMVERCLLSLQEPCVQLLIVDNGSESDVKTAIADKGIVIRNAINKYVNPAWNQAMEWFLECPGRYDLLVIANSDLVLDAGWADKLRSCRAEHSQEQIFFGKVGPQHSSRGAFFAMTQGTVLAACPIPDDLLIYGGDDFIFEVNRAVGFTEHVIDELTMFHAVSGTISRSPELWEIGRRDNARWHQHVLPKLVPERVKDVMKRCTKMRNALT